MNTVDPAPAEGDPRDERVERVERVERRKHWDERHRDGHIESPEPNPVLAAEASRLTPGSALEVACGDGTNAVWLARQGWQVTAVDWSSIALAKARERAAAESVAVTWIEADLLAWTPPTAAFDLVTIVYLHLPGPERRAVYARAAEAVAEGGRLLVIGHDRTNLTHGTGGPQDPELLLTAGELVADLGALQLDFEIEEAAAVRRAPPPERGPIDAVLRARRGAAPRPA